MSNDSFLAIRVAEHKWGKPIAEYRFHPSRKWRFDFAWPDKMVAIEIHGGVFHQGRHTRGSGFLKDREKMNTAQLMGWTVLEYSTRQGKEMIDDLTEVLG